MTRKSLLIVSGHGMAGDNSREHHHFLNYLQGCGGNMEVVKPCPSQASGWDKFQSQISGYTLIELLITLAVISILALNVFPNLSALLAQERSVVMTNNLAGALAYARTEAVTKQMTIITCQSNNGSECNQSENWHNGWIIFADKNQNKQREPEEMLLKVYAATDNGTQVIFNGSGAGIKYYMKYKPSGAAWPNGSFLICNPNIGVGKALIMTQSGRLRLSKIQTNGSAITCH